MLVGRWIILCPSHASGDCYQLYRGRQVGVANPPRTKEFIGKQEKSEIASVDAIVHREYEAPRGPLYARLAKVELLNVVIDLVNIVFALVNIVCSNVLPCLSKRQLVFPLVAYIQLRYSLSLSELSLCPDGMFCTDSRVTRV
jgi:hypothetical protein